MKIEDNEEDVKQLNGKKLLITSMPVEESRQKLRNEIENALEENTGVVRRNFTPETIRKILTPKRRELLNYIAENNPEGITQTAEELDRTVNEVSKDLQFLNTSGIVYFQKNKNMKQPVIPFKDIKIDYKLIDTEKNGLKA